MHWTHKVITTILLQDYYKITTILTDGVYPHRLVEALTVRVDRWASVGASLRLFDGSEYQGEGVGRHLFNWQPLSCVSVITNKIDK